MPASKAGVARATEGSNPSVTARWPRSPERSGLRGFVVGGPARIRGFVVGGPARIRNLSSGDLARNSRRGDGLLESMCAASRRSSTHRWACMWGRARGAETQVTHVGPRHVSIPGESRTAACLGNIPGGDHCVLGPVEIRACSAVPGSPCLSSCSSFPVSVIGLLAQTFHVTVPCPLDSSREHLMAKSASATRARGAGWGTIPS